MNSSKSNVQYFVIFSIYMLLPIFTISAQNNISSQTLNSTYSITLNIDKAKINNRTTEIIYKTVPQDVKFIKLRKEIIERVSDDSEDDPDIVYHIKVPVSGKYRIFTHVERDEDIKPGAKVETRFAKLQIDNQRITRRIVSDLYEYSYHDLGLFDLRKEQDLKIWLPKAISFESIKIEQYVAERVPDGVVNYIPAIVPPIERPRLWVNKDNLSVVKERLTKGENLLVWQKVQDKAKEPFPFKFDIRKEIFHNDGLEDAVVIKAFYYLITKDRTIGAEAVRLIVDYLSVLEFGNVRSGDITREIGKAIYTAALTYDWCYDILKDKDRQYIYSKMMNLASYMEIGWPPFKESVVSGHASEAQVNRDLFAMSIAVYDEDPEPYRYISYLILEDLLPMKAFEYQSQRHSQGFDYGAYRHGWAMHAVWMFYRMAGYRIFDENITNLRNYWLYMRLPNGLRLSDGDGFAKPHKAYSETILLDYAYSNDPILKAEFERRGGLDRIKENPILFLLLNDPDLKPDPDLNSLPLSTDFGPVVGGMIARTGWNMDEDSNDVIAEIKGGGYHFGNHQHCDAGAIQLYYHGQQICDLGIYYYYGSPYDFNFNKRSVSHSMMLVKDPDEKLEPRTKINDGGTRFNQKTPKTPLEVQTNPWFDNGTVLSADFEAQTLKPSYSYFKVDLTAAYSSKISNYTRSFCFLNLSRVDVPAAIILADDLIASKHDIEKYWKINTFNKPMPSDSNIILHNRVNNIVGKTYVNMLLPSFGDLNMEISSLRDSSSVLGPQYQVRSGLPEANGYQIIAYPKKKAKHNRFLTVFQMASDGTNPLPVDFRKDDNKYILSIEDRIVCMSAGYEQIQGQFTLSVEQDATFRILLTDLKPGFWNIYDKERRTYSNFKVEPNKNTIFFHGRKGDYLISPGRTYELNK
ncbi:hypothetical protein JGH11_08910 [Dysgonomonas sp. Marseille-P4677]|uniref:hypothetical protein n=1 Tax=Dysgonomonas sp. Marseille-P4677 TaxID=2364790 RepID=UPI001912275F|nr:hypothetical protein [Dysgonomonas sp. Marseille-P4677]MBK5720988.1 hypothetical protein [Dysgonomonas sp. Marseille-P4677]